MRKAVPKHLRLIKERESETVLSRIEYAMNLLHIWDFLTDAQRQKIRRRIDKQWPRKSE